MTENYTELDTLKAVIVILLKRWKLLLSIFFTVTVITAVLNYFVIPTSYKSSSDITIRFPKQETQQSGEYDFGTVYSDDLIFLAKQDKLVDRVADSLDFNISADSIVESTHFSFLGASRKSSDGQLVFNIEVTGKDKAQIREIADQYALVFTDYIKVYYKRSALMDYMAQCGIVMDRSSAELEIAQGKLAEIDAKMAEEPKTIAENGTVLINPNYEFLAESRSLLLTEIAAANAAVEKYSQLLTTYSAEYAAVETYLETGEDTGLNADIANILNNRIAVTESSNALVASMKLRNIFVAAVLSLILGATIALTAHYWKQK